MKRTAIRRVSKKRAKLLRDIAGEREKYVANRQCVVARIYVGKHIAREASEVHEIVGGRFRQRTEKDKRFWLAVYRLNHDELQGMTKAKQWALKLAFDPTNFDVSALSELPGSVVDPADVLNEIRSLLLLMET